MVPLVYLLTFLNSTLYWSCGHCQLGVGVTVSSGTHWVTLLFGWDRGWAFWL